MYLKQMLPKQQAIGLWFKGPPLIAGAAHG